MKKIISILLGAALSFTAFSQSKSSSTHVKSYTKKNGTVVHSHYRSKPDKTSKNNYSSKGNTNPYTGKRGTKKSKK